MCLFLQLSGHETCVLICPLFRSLPRDLVQWTECYWELNFWVLFRKLSYHTEGWKVVTNSNTQGTREMQDRKVSECNKKEFIQSSYLRLTNHIESNGQKINFLSCVEKRFPSNSAYDIRYEKLLVYLTAVIIIYILTYSKIGVVLQIKYLSRYYYGLKTWIL